jgi:hypothetical protein
LLLLLWLVLGNVGSRRAPRVGLVVSGDHVRRGGGASTRGVVVSIVVRRAIIATATDGGGFRSSLRGTVVPLLVSPTVRTSVRHRRIGVLHWENQVTSTTTILTYLEGEEARKYK